MTGWFDKSVEVFLRWLSCLWNPTAEWQRILRSGSAAKKIGRSLQLWAAISLLAFGLLLPAYKIGGVRYDDMTFYIPYVIYILVAQLVLVTAFHATLRIYRVRSRFHETLALHTVTIGAYVPIVTLLLSGVYARLFASMKEWKATGLPVSEWPRAATLAINYIDEIGAFGMMAGDVVLIAAGVLFCRAVSKHYAIDRTVAWSSVACASSVLAVLLYGIGVAPFYFVLVYMAL